MKAVIFDLFETLVTEWGRPKYLAHDVAKDLGVDFQLLSHEWNELRHDRYIGKYPQVEQLYDDILFRIGIAGDKKLLEKVAEKRKQTKRQCFDAIEQSVIRMLSDLKIKGYTIGLISNCSPEEICGLKECVLYKFFDVIVLSCDVGMVKPDKNIYKHCCSNLGVQPQSCYFVGDGGSDELQGAKNVGMKSLRALWFIKHFVENCDDNKNFPALYEPNELFLHL